MTKYIIIYKVAGGNTAFEELDTLKLAHDRAVYLMEKADVKCCDIRVYESTARYDVNLNDFAFNTLWGNV